MHKFISPALLAALTVPSATIAQSLPEGFEISGYIEVSEFSGDGPDESLGRLDVDIAQYNLFGNFGVSLGVDAYHVNGNTRSELYPAITYSFGDHMISAGMTRSVLDGGYVPDRQILGSSLFDLQLPGLGTSYMKQALLTAGSGADNLGLRWDGRFGDTEVGVSYNNISSAGPGSVDVYAVAVRHDLSGLSSAGDLDVFAGYERLNTDGPSIDIWTLGVEGQINRFGYGVSLGDADGLFGGHVRGWLDYDITDRLQVSAEVLSLNDGPDTTVYSLGVAYNVWNGLVAEANYIDSDSGGDGTTEFTLRYEF